MKKTSAENTGRKKGAFINELTYIVHDALQLINCQEERKLNKEKLLELLSEAIDRKADIRIHFSQFHKEVDYEPVSNEEAFSFASRFMDALNAPQIKQEIGAAGTKHYLVDHKQFGVCLPYIPSVSEEMDTKRQRIEHLKKEIAALENEEEVKA